MELIDQHVKRIMEGCKERARDAGLEFDKETLEFIVTNQDMIELSPKIMIPTLYSYWVHDVEVIKDKGRYQIYPGNAYETVINTRPAISFYNDNNPDWLNIMIFYHVLGHIDFFQNNQFFENTWYDDFLGKSLSDKREINSIRDEQGENKRFVDYIIEFTRGIDNLVNFYDPLKTELKQLEGDSEIDYFFGPFLREKDIPIFQYMDFHERYNKYIEIYGEVQGKTIFFGDIREAFPEFKAMYKKREKDKKNHEKCSDLIDFLIKKSPVVQKEENWWMGRVMQIVRDTSMYFQPQIRTKILNEGWACIVGDSLVHTEDGFVNIKKAQEYCNKVVGIDNKLTKIGDKIVTKELKTIKIKTNRFFNIEGAEDHRILVIDEKGNKKDLKLKELKEGTEVVLSSNHNIWPEKYIKIDDTSCKQKLLLFPGRQQKVNIPTYIDEDLAYFMGSFVAEGCWLGRGFAFKNSDKDYIERIKKIITDKFDKEPHIYYSKEGKMNLTLYSTMVLEFLKQIGFSTDTNSLSIRVPWSILQSPKNVVSAFIGGYTDGDGCVYYDEHKNARSIILTSKNEKLLEEIAILLSNFGIIGHHSYSRKKGYDVVHQLCICSGLNIKKFYENIDLRDEKRKNLLKKSVNNIKQPREIIYTAKVKEISYNSNITYDWEIPEGHYYSAQGFINHNSYWHQELFEKDNRISTHETDYAIVNAKVMSNPRFGLNPYAVGYKLLCYFNEMGEKGRINNFQYQLLHDIEKRSDYDLKTDKGLETIFGIRKNFNDFMAIDFLDDQCFQDFVTTNNLYVTGKRLNPERRTWEYYIKSKKGEDYRDMIIDNLYHPPKIKFFVNEDGHLVLEHVFEGKSLYTEYIKNVLIGLEYLWGNVIKLITNEFIVEEEQDYYHWMTGQVEEFKYKEVKVLYTCKNRKIERKEIDEVENKRSN